MRILFLTHCVPYPADKGERIRAYHQVRHLAARHRVHLFCLSQSGDDDLELRRRALAGLVEQVEVFGLRRWRSALSALSALFLGRPLTIGYFSHRALLQRLARIPAGTFDVVLASCSSMAPYALAMRELPRVIDLVDADSAKWQAYARFVRPPRRWLYSLEGRRLAAYEASLPRGFRKILVTTPREARRLGNAGGVVEAVPNGIDCEHFRPAGAPLGTRPPTIAFTGQMDYFPNVDAAVWFARRVMPELTVRVNGARFVVVGRRPVEAVRRLESLPGVTVAGEVADVRPHLDEAAVFVAPLRIARGVQNKVLEAMACGVPVVATSEVAAGLEDTRLVAGEDYLVADGPEAFRNAVLRQLLDREGAGRMAVSARQKISDHCDWGRSMARLDALLVQAAAVESHRPAPALPGLGFHAWNPGGVTRADP